ncbi:MAG: GntR family transcriptional regulator [Verrucomicrobia bacterium]|nr:GntR family transcriptional regulator [Verrucomicrobiota bacterium]
MRPINTSISSKKDLVKQALREAILNGELAPGTRLIIDDLATKLGVSPIPVREALQQLQADGYVEIQPFLGTRVTPIEAESVVEVFSLLETIETVTSRFACLHLTEDERGTLNEIVAGMETLVAAGDAEAWSKENRRFHQIICDRAGTRLISSVMTKVLDHWDRLHRVFLTEVFAKRLPEAQQEHREILRAIEERDPARVEKIIREHNRHALRAYQEYLAKRGLSGEEETRDALRR